MGVELLGRLTCYEDTKANCEVATAILQELRFARATDTGELGILIDGAWTWYPGTAGSGSGSGEVLMQDGVSSPPVPLETEDGSDWIYAG